MGDYERALETAGTGIGVVFLALVALMLITMALTRYLKENGRQGDGSPDASLDPETIGDESVVGQGDDPAVIAAMVAAIQLVRGGVARVIRRSTDAPASSSWRFQGRQALMGSQGIATYPRTQKR